MDVNHPNYKVGGREFNDSIRCSGQNVKKATITEAQLQAVIEHYENARMDGLCHEGAWEVALSHINDLHISTAALIQLEATLRG